MILRKQEQNFILKSYIVYICNGNIISKQYHKNEDNVTYKMMLLITSWYTTNDISLWLSTYSSSPTNSGSFSNNKVTSLGCNRKINISKKKGTEYFI